MNNSRKNNSKNTTKNDLLAYIELLQKDPKEKAAMNKLLQKEQKKLAKNQETEFAAMFLSAIKF